MKIGIDSEQISRMNERLLDKISTTNEREYVNKFKNKKPHIASLWTGKEAVIKVLGEKNISFLEIEILHDFNGAPHVNLLGRAKQRLEELNLKSIEISITHTKTVATAIVLAR